jgi:hypothetical protein
MDRIVVFETKDTSSSLVFPTYRSDGIGRHTGLRNQRRNALEFESLLRYTNIYSFKKQTSRDFTPVLSLLGKVQFKQRYHGKYSNNARCMER